MGAVVASLLETTVLKVPPFHMYKEVDRSKVYFKRMKEEGYSFAGAAGPENAVPHEEDSIDGLFHAVVVNPGKLPVPSSVIMNVDGIVVYDPSPYKLWLGADLVKGASRALYWMRFRPVPKPNLTVVK